MPFRPLHNYYLLCQDCPAETASVCRSCNLSYCDAHLVRWRCSSCESHGIHYLAPASYWPTFRMLAGYALCCAVDVGNTYRGVLKPGLPWLLIPFLFIAAMVAGIMHALYALLAIASVALWTVAGAPFIALTVFALSFQRVTPMRQYYDYGLRWGSNLSEFSVKLYASFCISLSPLCIFAFLHVAMHKNWDTESLPSLL